MILGKVANACFEYRNRLFLSLNFCAISYSFGQPIRLRSTFNCLQCGPFQQARRSNSSQPRPQTPNGFSQKPRNLHSTGTFNHQPSDLLLLSPPSQVSLGFFAVTDPPCNTTSEGLRNVPCRSHVVIPVSIYLARQNRLRTKSAITSNTRCLSAKSLSQDAAGTVTAPYRL